MIVAITNPIERETGAIRSVVFSLRYLEFHTYKTESHILGYETRSIRMKCARTILPFALSVSSRIFMIRANDMTYGGHTRCIHIFNGIKRRARRFIDHKWSERASWGFTRNPLRPRSGHLPLTAPSLPPGPAIAETLSLSTIRFR